MDLDEAFFYWFVVISVLLFVVVVSLYVRDVVTAFPRVFTAGLIVLLVPPLLIYFVSNWFESDGGESR